MGGEVSNRWNRSDALAVRGIIERINFCGCGTDAHWRVTKLLLEKAEDHNANGSFYDEKDAVVPWVEFGAKVLDSFGLTEHGTGIGWAWLTDDGKLLLRFLRDFGTESYCMDDGTGQPEWAYEFSWTGNAVEHDSFDEWEKSLTLSRKAASN